MTDTKQGVNLHVMELAAYEAPVVTESNKNDWVEYGENNDYYDWLIERYRTSPTNNSCINNISRLIYGRGLDALDSNRKPTEYAQMISLFRPDVLKPTILNGKMLGAGVFQIIYNKAHTKIDRVEHLQTRTVRTGKCDKDGAITTYWFSDNWEEVKKFPPKKYSAFGTSKDEIELMVVSNYSVKMKYYTEVDYFGCLPYAVLEEEISEYLINDIQNGFSGTKVVNFNNGVPGEAEQDKLTKKVYQKLTGSQGLKTIVAFNDNAENKTTVEDIPLTDAPEHYQYLSNEAQQKILNCHNVTSSMLVGIAPEGSGFSSTADEIETGAKYFYNQAAKPWQDLFLDAINQILAFNGITLKTHFRRLDLLESIEEKQQVKEELTLSKTLTDVLNEIGEDQGEDWELIDEREVDYDLETDLDEQVESWSLVKEPSLLSKVYNLVTTGTARPNAKSSQDKEVNGFFFKVRYQYTGDKTGERDFCKQMLSADKLYRKEDLVNLNSNVANPGQGHNGEDYNIFLYKGGVNCHHKWVRKTFVSASKGIDTKSPNATTISTNKAQKFGYRVDNPKEVAQKPIDMPNNGHHPNF